MGQTTYQLVQEFFHQSGVLSDSGKPEVLSLHIFVFFGTAGCQAWALERQKSFHHYSPPKKLTKVPWRIVEQVPFLGDIA